MKSWLSLPCNCTPGTVFHSDVLNLPLLPHLKQSAKLSYVLAVEQSVDPLIVELQYSVLANSPDDSPTVLNSLSAVKASVANVHSATFKSHAHHDLCHTHVDYWESKFETLTVQNKFLYIVTLEKQLSFLLCVG